MIGLRLVKCGPWASVQDLGRPGLQRHGISESGAMDPLSLRIANRLVGNVPRAAGLETGLPGLTIEVEGAPATIAVCGPSAQVWLDGQAVPANRSFRLQPGQVLRLRPGPDASFAYLAAMGGLDLPEVFGSRAFHARSGLGGIGGAALEAGVLLPTRGISGPELSLDCIMPHSTGPIGVLEGPQHCHIEATSWQRFLNEIWRVGARSDRMGVRLEGPVLHHSDKGYNIVSDGVTLGCVQLPGNGHPIVLAADRQTTGGYPKIAVIPKADMISFVQRPHGATVTFCRRTHDEAVNALRALDRWIESAPLRPINAQLDSATLLAANLIDGVVRG